MDEQWSSPYSPGGEYDGIKYGWLPVNYRIFSIVLCINMIRCPRNRR
jgi:hypothetical protein